MNSLLSIRNIAVAAALAALTGFSTSASAQDSVAKAKPTSTTKVRPLSIAVDLISGTNLSGTLTDAVSLEMRTSFGSASIPLSEVAGIRFASADNASTTVVMLNGDSITGATDVKLITVETEWGTAKINGVSIASILFVPGLSWNSQAGLNGKRWNLADEKPAAPSAPATGGAVIALLDRADSYRASGDSANEAAAIERALRIEPNNARLWSRLAATRLEQGQPRQAEQLALKSNALSRGDRRLQAQNWQLVARARWALDDSAGARAAEKKARDLGGS